MSGDLRTRTFYKFDELVEFLEHWRVWSSSEPHEYDVNSMLRLLGACATNLGKFALDAELADIAEVLAPEQIAFFKKLGRLLDAPKG